MSDHPPTRGITGVHTHEGRPHGFSSLTPFLALEDPAGALLFYQQVFGARVVGVTEMPLDGKTIIVHAELVFAQGRLQLGAPNALYQLVGPPTGGQVCYSLGLYVLDVDATVEAAVARGATLREPPTHFVSGDRYASLVDPFGVRWSVMTRVEDLSEAESQARVDAWARSAGA